MDNKAKTPTKNPKYKIVNINNTICANKETVAKNCINPGFELN